MSAARPLLACECCGLVSRPAAPCDGPVLCRCPRCGHPLHRRNPRSLQNTWAYLAAAAMLYVPANTLPIMSTTNFFRRDTYTIVAGIEELWTEASWLLAIIVFTASIAVPLLKIGALALLAWSVRHAPAWRRSERARLYRIVDAVGHWSMLDVYVVVLLSGVVHFGRIASVQPEPGLLAFAAVVMLTMLASRSFDPRLIWEDRPTDG
ncbi:MAG TPA: paraquat-inducible protein A [Albitalea sp.]